MYIDYGFYILRFPALIGLSPVTISWILWISMSHPLGVAPFNQNEESGVVVFVFVQERGCLIIGSRG